eukprot:350384-Chlamydomonas_euryale.AAC.6
MAATVHSTSGLEEVTPEDIRIVSEETFILSVSSSRRSASLCPIVPPTTDNVCDRNRSSRTRFWRAAFPV